MKKYLVCFLLVLTASCSPTLKKKHHEELVTKSYREDDYKTGKYGVVIAKIVTKSKVSSWNLLMPQQTAILTNWEKERQDEKINKNSNEEVIESFSLSQGEVKDKMLLPESSKMEEAEYQLYLIEAGKYKMIECSIFNKYLVRNSENYYTDCLQNLSFNIEADEVVYIGDFEFSMKETKRTFKDRYKSQDVEIYIKNNLPELEKRLEDIDNELAKKVKFVEVKREKNVE